MEMNNLVNIIVILFSNIIIFFIVLFLLKKHYKKKNEFEVIQLVSQINKKLSVFDEKFIFELEDKEISNLSSEEIILIKNQIKNGNYIFQDYVINKEEDTIYLNSSKNTREIEGLKNRIDEVNREMEKIRDKEYYFYKGFIEKLTFILSEINEFYKEIKDTNNINVKFKLENLKDKVEFLLEFFKEKGNIEFHKYRLHRIKNLVDMLKEEFDEKIFIEFNLDNNLNSYYIELDKIFAVIKSMIYSVLKLKISEKDKNIIIDMSVNTDFIHFAIRSNTNSFSFLRLIDEEFLFIDQMKEKKWKFSVEESIVEMEVPIKSFEGEQSEEIKSIIINSKLSYIKEIIKLVLYDMNKFGFNNDEIYDMRLTLDELLVNAIEHGNKFDETKKVHINYKFLKEGKKIIIDIEDEGDGFDIEDIKEPDILSLRGRGISIIKKLVNEVKYYNYGRKVIISKEKEV